MKDEEARWFFQEGVQRGFGGGGIVLQPKAELSR
jgi:hypothetical protein